MTRSGQSHHRRATFLARTGAVLWLIAMLIALQGSATPQGLAASIARALQPAGTAGLAPVERATPPATLARDVAGLAGAASRGFASGTAGGEAGDDAPLALPNGVAEAARAGRNSDLLVPPGAIAAPWPVHTFEARGPPPVET